MKARPSCPHGHADTCEPCGAAAHLHAVRHAVVAGISCPDDDAAQDLADLAVANALDAQKGYRVLREHGIAPPMVPNARALFWCRFCGGTPAGRGPCICWNPRCPGRRVRMQLPAVRR